MQSATALYCLLPMKPPEHRTVFDHQAVDAIWSADQAPSRVNRMPLHPTIHSSHLIESPATCVHLSLAASHARSYVRAGPAKRSWPQLRS